LAIHKASAVYLIWAQKGAKKLHSHAQVNAPGTAKKLHMMMMIAFITVRSSLVPLIEGLCDTVLDTCVKLLVVSNISSAQGQSVDLSVAITKGQRSVMDTI